MQNREFINCECCTEGLIIDQADEPPYEIDLALWSYGQKGGTLSFFERLRWCWNILRKGIPWADCVVLHEAEAQRLVEILNRKIEVIHHGRTSTEKAV